jgi:hypothetical protein
MQSRPVIVCATQDFAREFWGGDPPFSFRGYVALLGREVVGVGGVYRMGGRLWLFSGYLPDLAPYRKVKAKAVRLLIQLVDRYDEPVYATPDPTEPTAVALLTKLGFEPTGETVADGSPVLVRGR